MKSLVKTVLLSSLFVMLLAACGGGGSSGTTASTDPLIGSWSVSSVDGAQLPIPQADGSMLDSIVIRVADSSTALALSTNYNFLQTTSYSFVEGGDTYTLTCEDRGTLGVQDNTMTSIITTTSACVDQDGASVDLGEGANEADDANTTTFVFSNNDNTLTVTESSGEVTVYERV